MPASLLTLCWFLLPVVSLLTLTRICLLVATVQGDSMAPTLLSGERVLAWRLLPTLRLREGQVVLVAQEQQARTIPYIKRIIALEGEICTTSPRAERETDEPTNGGFKEKTWHIPPGHVFVCGDNQASSVDSRIWGPLPRRRILGIVLMKLPGRTLSPPSKHVKALPQQGPQRGKQAPPFQAHTMNGICVTQHTYRGEAILLIFIGRDYASRRSMPTYQTFFNNLNPLGIKGVFVCNADKEDILTFSIEMQVTQPIIIAPGKQNPFFKDYQIDIVPAYCLIDEKGFVRATGPASLALFSNVANVARYMGFTSESKSNTLTLDGAKEQ